MKNALSPTLLSLSLLLLSPAYGQDFKNPSKGDSLVRLESQNRLIRGATPKVAESLIIDALMDNDWFLTLDDAKSVNLRTADKFVLCKSKILIVNNTLSLVKMVYSVHPHREGSRVQITLMIDPGCTESDSREIQASFYKRFWESASFGRFYESLRIESLEIR